MQWKSDIVIILKQQTCPYRCTDHTLRHGVVNFFMLLETMLQM